MTNSSDLSKCMHQLEILRGLTPNEEIATKIDLLTTKVNLLKQFPPRDWQTILKGLESGALKYLPGKITNF